MENYAKVLELVKTVLKENYVIEPPVSVVDIAGNYGLTVLESGFEEHPDVAGFIDPLERKIVINSSDSPPRKAFTIAHELGHWLLHREKLEQDPDEYAVLYRIPLGRSGDDPIEKEANFFAANLLVPRIFLDEYYRKRNYDSVTLAEICGVSLEVVGYRLKNEYGAVSKV